jgi:hypothetical protein
VKNVNLFAGDGDRDRDLLPNRIVTRTIDDWPEVRTEGADCLAVLRTAEQDVLARTIEPGEVTQEIPDVGTDSEVVQFAGINRDAHASA